MQHLFLSLPSLSHSFDSPSSIVFFSPSLCLLAVHCLYYKYKIALPLPQRLVSVYLCVFVLAKRRISLILFFHTLSLASVSSFPFLFPFITLFFFFLLSSASPNILSSIPLLSFRRNLQLILRSSSDPISVFILISPSYIRPPSLLPHHSYALTLTLTHTYSPYPAHTHPPQLPPTHIHHI
ncbi:MAG: hypothetical protein BYD32DRAFT_196814 [Podila humilis]|nr:MAG: hypothetical protein BYD32DRAFT_196814 [Podila humilis]